MLYISLVKKVVMLYISFVSDRTQALSVRPFYLGLFYLCNATSHLFKWDRFVIIHMKRINCAKILSVVAFEIITGITNSIIQVV